MKNSLLTAGILLAGLALFMGTLTVAGAAIRQPVTGTVLTVKSGDETLPTEEVLFPFSIEGTPLTVESLVVYEGPALEEGSDEPLVDVLAVLLQNTGSEEVLSAQILLQGKDVIHRFSGSHIPAGGKALLIEMNNAPWSHYLYSSCSGTAVLAAETGYSSDEIRVEESAMGELTLTNLTGQKLTGLCMYHKSFLEGMDICIGGITYLTDIGTLEPDEIRTITPEHYATGYSKVIRIE